MDPTFLKGPLKSLPEKLPENVKLISWDVGGTLLLPARPIGASYARLLADWGFEADPQTLEERFQMAFREKRNGRALSDQKEKVNEATERMEWLDLVKKVLPEWSTLPDFPAFFDHLWNYFASADAWVFAPGAEETLETIRKQGIPQVILSNWDGRLPTLLEQMGIHSYMTHILYSTGIGWEKPHPRSFQTVEKATGLSGQAILHVGDHPREDITAALNAGWQAWQV